MAVTKAQSGVPRRAGRIEMFPVCARIVNRKIIERCRKQVSMDRFRYREFPVSVGIRWHEQADCCEQPAEGCMSLYDR